MFAWSGGKQPTAPYPRGPDDFFHMVIDFPPDAPAWHDFGLNKAEFLAELHKIEPFELSQALRAFYRLYAAKNGKARYGDKTPTYCEKIPEIEKLFPEAAFIHVIRDGRDVALSLRQTWFSPGDDMKTLANYWVGLIARTREAGSRSPAYAEVRFESLVRHTEQELRAICVFLDLEYDPCMLRYWEHTPERLREHRARLRKDGSQIVSHEQRLRQQHLTTRPPQVTRISAWKQQMTPAERLEFERHAGHTLAQLGYET
jgi:hypothetical protein